MKARQQLKQRERAGIGVGLVAQPVPTLSHLRSSREASFTEQVRTAAGSRGLQGSTDAPFHWTPPHETDQYAELFDHGESVSRGVTRLLSALLPLLLTTACALGTTPVAVRHTAFPDLAASMRADLLVRTFSDSRPDERKPYIGAKRNGYGMVLGHFSVPKDEKLDALMTRYFVEALQQAGFRAVAESDASSVPPERFHPVAVVEGEIERFWLDMYFMVWEDISILVRLRDRSNEVLWESRFDGAERNLLWIGLNAEIRKVIRQALDKALEQAIREFREASFAEQVRIAGERTPATDGKPSEAGGDPVSSASEGAAPAPLPERRAP